MVHGSSVPVFAFAILALTVAQAPDDAGTLNFYPDGGSPVSEPAWLHISGNKVVPEEMYRNVLAIPPDAEPTAEMAQQIEESLTLFLQQSGYELATVRVVQNPFGINVLIDEGRLDKIVFRGRLTALTLRFRLELHIEQDIFNRPELERQIAELTKNGGLRVVKWSLVPTKQLEHMGPQLDNMPAIEGFEILHARDRYELHFFFEEAEWDTGFGLDLRSGYIDGLEIGVNEQFKDILIKGERLRIAASVGAGLHTQIPDGQYFPAFTRAAAELVWYLPRLANRVTPYLWLTSQVVNRERADLGLQAYGEVSAVASGHALVDFTKTFNVTFGIGEQWRRIFFEQVAPGANQALIDTLPLTERLRTFVDARGYWLINSEVERADRSHALEFGARYYFGTALAATTTQDQGELQFAWVYERYHVVIPFGWHDLWLKSSARVLWGDVQFHDEESLGELLRGVFGNNFIRKGGNGSAEFRFSLSRDVLKLSLFVEAAAWGEVNRLVVPNTETFRYGITGGPGFHALIQGMFQLDIYGSFGITSTRALGFGVVVFLNKVF